MTAKRLPLALPPHEGMSAMHIINRRRSSVAVGLTLFLVVAACGGSDESGVEYSLVASEAIADPFETAGFALAGDDVSIDAPSLMVEAGEEVTVNIENAHGQYSRTSGIHNFAIVPELDDLATLAATGAVTDLVLWESATPDIPSGESSSVTFTPDAPGTYYYICTIPGHADGGMIGEFVVS